MALEYSTFAHGGTVFPLSGSLTNSLLRDGDPSLYWCLDYFSFVINAYLGARIVAEAAACGAPISAAVAYSLPDDPKSFLTQSQVKFPLLSLHRESDVLTDKTITWRGSRSTWKLHYVLPTLDAGQRERLIPTLRAVSAIVDNRIENTYDPGYLGGAKVFGPSYANLEYIRALSASYGDWENGDGLSFPSIAITIEVAERDTVVPGAFDHLAGIDTSEDLANTGQVTVPDVIQFKIDTP